MKALIITVIIISTTTSLASEMTNDEEAQKAISNLLQSKINNEFSSLNALNCELEDIDCLSKELQERYRLDQWIRAEFNTLDICGEYKDTYTQACQNSLMGSMVFQIDLPNTKRLKQIMHVHSFPSTPTFSAKTQEAAWYLVQHAQFIGESGMTQWDADLAESILPFVKRAIKNSDLTPWHYATMSDRIALTRGESQKYATQVMCNNGKAEFRNLEDPNKVNDYRNDIGMKLFVQADYDKFCSTQREM